MLCSMGAFTVVEMNMKPLKEKKKHFEYKGG